MPFLIVFAVAFGLSVAIAPVAARLGRTWGLVDVPAGRRRHRGVVPRTGGIALFVAFVLAVLVAAPLSKTLPAPEGVDPKETIRLVGVLLGSTFLFLVGLYDDRYELKPLPQILAQSIASLIAIGCLVFIERVMNPFTDSLHVFRWYVTAPITIFWIMGMMNTVNFLDGLDGLAVGVTAIVAAVLFVHMYREGQYSVSLLPLALLGSALGFLPYNRYPARVFMGSAGSYFVGYAVATLSIVAGARMATMLLVLAVPILDVGWQILVRGFSQRRVVALYWFLSASFAVLALFVPSRLFKLGALVFLGVVIVAILAVVTWVGERREASQPHSAEDGDVN